MGRPKQLLEIDGEPLLVRIAREILHGGATPVVVVLGCEADQCAETLVALPVITVVNADWSRGQSASLRLGLETLQTHDPKCEAALIALCDQVNLTASVITGLIATQRHTGKGIVASRYAQTLGAPALFSSQYFPRIASLRGDHGARALIDLAGGDLAVLPVSGRRDRSRYALRLPGLVANTPLHRGKRSPVELRTVPPAQLRGAAGFASGPKTGNCATRLPGSGQTRSKDVLRQRFGRPRSPSGSSPASHRDYRCGGAAHASGVFGTTGDPNCSSP